MRQTKTPHSCGHRVARLATLVMLLGFLGALQSKAQTAYALYNDSTLTFYYDENQPDSNYFDMSFHTDPAYGKVPSWYELCDSVDTIVFDASFADYRPTDCTAWFCGYYLLKNIDGMENFHTDSVKSMNNMFCACSNLYNVDLSHFNTENVEDMSRMFYFSTGFSTLDLSYFNTKNVKDMSEMFYWSYYLGTIFASETFTVESVRIARICLRAARRWRERSSTIPSALPPATPTTSMAISPTRIPRPLPPLPAPHRTSPSSATTCRAAVSLPPSEVSTS